MTFIFQLIDEQWAYPNTVLQYVLVSKTKNILYNEDMRYIDAFYQALLY